MGVVTMEERIWREGYMSEMVHDGGLKSLVVVVVAVHTGGGGR